MSKNILSVSAKIIFIIMLPLLLGLASNKVIAVTKINNTSLTDVNFPTTYLLLSPKVLAENKRNLNKTSDNVALTSLIDEANKFLTIEPPSISHKTLLPPSGSPNDYMSIGPYWWPDKSTENGEPWIKKDGETNPITRNKDNDKTQLRHFNQAIKTLSYAYYFTDNTKYAEKAKQILETWFINPKTRMNPNLNFAQAIPGRVDGRGIGIIEFAELPNVLDAIYLLNDQLSNDKKLALKNWYTEFYHWMKTSKNGQDEAKTINNHASFYNLIMLSLSTSLNEKTESLTYINNAKTLINNQIEVTGEQPHELERTKPFHYSIYNLRALFAIAKIAERYEQNLWFYPSVEQAKLQSALSYMFSLSPTTTQSGQWQDLQKYPVELERLIALLSLSSTAYPKFTKQALMLPSSAKIYQQTTICNLMFSPIKINKNEAPESFRLCII